MKTVRIAILILLANHAGAQWIVYDPTMNAQQIISQAENMAKYVQMIDNQVQQINTLTHQLEELQKYNQAFGNPATLLNITGVTGLANDLARQPVGQSYGQIQAGSQGQKAMTFNGSGLYFTIGETYTTPSGSQIQREPNKYRENAAVENTVQNYTNVLNDVLNRRRTIKNNIATTTKKLQSATTASEVQKLTGVLVGLNGDLAGADKEVDHAVSQAVVQDAENRDNTEKQSKARTEEQQTEFSEALTNYGTTFQPITGPPTFPTSN
jgi:hypothetical protein